MAGVDVAMLRIPLLSVEAGVRAMAGGPLPPEALTAIALSTDTSLFALAESQERAGTAVRRYVARMCGRATPFGLFAGTAGVKLGPSRELVLARDSRQARVRIDIDVLRRVVQDAVGKAGRSAAIVKINPTAYRVGQCVRFTRVAPDGAEVVEIQSTTVIDELIRIMGNSARLVSGISVDLSGRAPSLPRRAIEDLIDQLATVGLLVPAADLLEPGVEPADRAVSLLRAIGDDQRASRLEQLIDSTGNLQPLDADFMDGLRDTWDKAAEHIPTLTGVPLTRRLHVDLELQMSAAMIDQRTADELVRSVRTLQGLTAQARSGRGFDLDRFRAVFQSRFEDAEVPLLVALDLEGGVLGSTHPRSSNLATEAGVRQHREQPRPELDPFVADCYDRWLQHGEAIDIAGLAPVENCLAGSLVAALLDNYEGRYLAMLMSVSHRSPVALMARFGLRPAGTTSPGPSGASASERLPEQQRVMTAELAHDPGGRAGNILIRPRLTDEVIALQGAVGSLSLNRLLIRLERGQFRLRDSVSGRPVLVELNTAHNVDHPDNHPLYTALAYVSGARSTGAAVTSWSWWGLSGQTRLPRVTCGPIIISPEKWQVEGRELRDAIARQTPARSVRRLLPGLGSRRWVGVGVGDRVLPIDLTSDRWVMSVLHRAARQGRVTVTEMPQVEAPAVHGPTGRHVAEVVLPLPRQQVTGLPLVGTSAAAAAERGRAWVYVKYFGGPAAADEVITRAHQLATQLSRSGAIDGWHFVRYWEDGPHVRVRMRPSRTKLRGVVLTALDELGLELQRDRLVHRVATDTWSPEVGRYGGMTGLAQAEPVFTASSDQTAMLVATQPSETLRLARAVADILHWSAVLFPVPHDRIDFVRRCQAGPGTLSFAPDGNRHGKLYRRQRKELNHCLSRYEPDSRLTDALIAYAELLRSELTEAQARAALGSALHMHCNRLFAFDPRRLEFLAHEWASRVIQAEVHGVRPAAASTPG